MSSNEDASKFADYEGLTMIGVFLAGLICFILSNVAYNNYVLMSCKKKLEQKLLIVMGISIVMIVMAITYSTCAYKYDCSKSKQGWVHMLILFILSIVILALASDMITVATENSDCNGDGQDEVAKEKAENLNTLLGNMITLSTIVAIASAGGIIYIKWDDIKSIVRL